MRLIGLMGKSKSGKDTVGKFLVEHDQQGATIAFADKLKEVCMDLFGFTHEDVYTEEGKAKPTDLPVLKCPACQSITCQKVSPFQAECTTCKALGEVKAFQTFWTPRMVLQFIGTEGVRRVDENAWVKHAIKRADSMLASKKFIAITDCRFKSEMKAIKEAGGEIWRIRRPETDRNAAGLAGHQSETEMDTIPDSEFHYVINNDASLDVLKGKSIEALNQFLREHL